MKRDESTGGVPSARPLPNYGRAVSYGFAAALIGAAFWVVFQIFTGMYAIILALAAGWLCGTSVKRGMGIVSRAGIGLSFYFTAMTVLLGESAYFAWHYVQITGRLSLGGALGLLATSYAESPMRLIIMLIFTLTGMVIALIYSR